MEAQVCRSPMGTRWWTANFYSNVGVVEMPYEQAADGRGDPLNEYIVEIVNGFTACKIARTALEEP